MEDNKIDENKRLSLEKEYQNTLDNTSNAFTTLRQQWDYTFDIGRKLGYSDIKIGDDLRARCRGLKSDSTLQRMLPDSAKHMKHASKHKTEPVILTGSRQPRLVTDEEPTIPLPPQTVKEVQPEYIEEKVKGKIKEPESKFQSLSNLNQKVILDSRKFGLDLKVAVSNKSKIELTINNNEVVKIKEI